MSIIESTIVPALPYQPIISSDIALQDVAWWKDYAALTKPRILLMILLTVVMGMLAFAHRSLSFGVFFHTLVGTTLIASSASILNQWLEATYDALMPRTASRPLPSGRLSSFEAAVFGWSTGVIGIIYLIATTNWIATLVGLATWISYVWIYTPMKQWTWWNTAVGTLPGALPVLIGWTAAGGSLSDSEGWLLTSIVIVWQFPHFMAIAWLYRNQYDLAGYRMITNVEPSGLLAGCHAIVFAVLLIPISICAVTPDSGLTWVMAILGAATGLPMLMASYHFFKERNDMTARTLLRSSLIYLPSVMLIVMIRSAI